jgi:uncharacterized membrane protein YdjX (TVP38/TMEM64 family)
MKFTRKPEKKDWLNICCILVILGILIWVGFKYVDIYKILKGDDLITTAINLKNAILSYGSVSLIVILFLHVLHVIISIIPASLIQFAGGLIYGIPIGMAVGILGVAAGTAASFYMSRFFGRRAVTLFVSEKSINKMDGLISNNTSAMVLLILYIIPFPKDFIAYFIGLTNMKAFKFFMISAIGRLPGMFVATYLGANLLERDYALLIITGSVTLASLALFYVFKDRLLDLLSSSHNPFRKN